MDPSDRDALNSWQVKRIGQSGAHADAAMGPDYNAVCLRRPRSGRPLIGNDVMWLDDARFLFCLRFLPLVPYVAI